MVIHAGGRGPGHIARSNTDPTIAALRALASTGGQYPAMASPPTATLGAVGGATAIPTSTTTYNWQSANLLRTAGAWKQYGTTYPDTLAGKGVSTTFLAGTSEVGHSYAVEFMFTGRYIEPYCLNKGFKWMLVVDGEYFNLPDYPLAGGGSRCLIDFGSVVTGKHIRLEHQGGGQFGPIDILTESTATVTAVPAYAQKLVIFGDSYIEGNGAATERVSLAHMTAQELGFSDHRISGSGGTGWIQDNPGVRINGFDRWTADVVNIGPTMVISLMGFNDIGDGNDATIQATLATKLDELIAAYPGCLINVFNPPNTSAPTVPSNYTSLSAAMEAACSGKRNVKFHDISSVSFTKWDGTHPDAAGHVTLYKAIYNKIAAAYGLHTVA